MVFFFSETSVMLTISTALTKQASERGVKAAKTNEAIGTSLDV